jgi:hypothetical protein
MLKSNTPVAVLLASSPEAQMAPPGYENSGVTVAELMNRQTMQHDGHKDTFIFYSVPVTPNRCSCIYQGKP